MKKILIIAIAILTISCNQLSNKNPEIDSSNTVEQKKEISTMKRGISYIDSTNAIIAIGNIKNYIALNKGKTYSVSVIFNGINNHFPNYDISSIINNSPVYSTGIRVYYGLDSDKKLHNYLVFTAKETNVRYADVEFKNAIFEVLGDFEYFMHPVDHLHPKTNHHTCPGNLCPQTSIVDANI